MGQVDKFSMCVNFGYSHVLPTVYIKWRAYWEII